MSPRLYRAYYSQPGGGQYDCISIRELEKCAGPAVTAANISNIPVTNLTTRGIVEQSELITVQIRQMLADPGISPSDILK